MQQPRPLPDWPSLWRPFSARDRTVLGVAAAFALVATANSNVSSLESRRFSELVHGARLARDSTELGALTAAFSALTEAMLAMPAEGRAEAIEILGTFAGDPFRTEIILSAAHAAMLADAEVSAAEHAALEAVCQGIGVNPRHLVRR